MFHDIAYRLHQPRYVVEDMEMSEVRDWIAYFRIRDRESKG